jgi:outer membrane receptor for ferrienterochelin and colicin
MPYQITGARANFDLGRGFVARIGVYNGWDRIVKDNNKQKAMMASLEWTDPNDEENYVFFNYMMGNERDPDDERGRTPPRHTFDLYAQWHAASRCSSALWTFSGFEHRPGATDGWLGLAGFAPRRPAVVV